MRIKILHVIKSLGRGGAEMLLPETLTLHDQDKFEFHYIYFLPWKDQLAEAIKKIGGKVICISANNNITLLTQYYKVMDYVCQHDIDLIHAHLPWAGFVSRLIFKRSGIPVVYSEHNKQERYHSITKCLNNYTFNWQSIAIAVSEDVKKSIEVNIEPSIKVKTILNGVNTDKFNPEAVSSKEIRNQLNIDKDAPLIGNVAVFRTQKRLDVWLEQAAIIKQSFPQAHFVLVGDGPTESLVLDKIKQLGLGGCTHLPGRLEKVIPWLSAINIFMISSEFEGLPIALLEAMSMEVPVVSTDAGGIKEVIEHLSNGWLVPVDHPERLSEGVIYLLTHTDQAQVLGRAARIKVIQYFSIQRMVTELEELYIKTLTNSGTANH